jgi:hypothetical protein
MRKTAMWAGLTAAAAMLAACGSSDSTSSSAAAATPTPTPVATPAPTPAVAVAPKVVITPNHAKPGDSIHAVGSGYKPNIAVTGTVCALDATGMVPNPLAQCDVVNTVTVTPDATGAFSTDFKVVKFPPPVTGGLGYALGFGSQTDAADSSGAALTKDG